MRRTLLIFLLAATGIALLAAPAFAHGGHHDEYDSCKWKPWKCETTTTAVVDTTTTGASTTTATDPTTTTAPETTTSTTEPTTTSTEATTTTTEATTTSTQPPTSTTEAPTTSTEASSSSTIVTTTTDPVTTTSIGERLPHTGSSSGYLALLGVLMLGAGTLLALTRPRTAKAR